MPNEIFGKVGEAYLLQTSGRTAFGTKSASGTLGVVHNCAVVNNRDGVVGADLFALFAANAGVLASLARIRSLVLAAAVNCHSGSLRNHGDDFARTFPCAHSASYTAARVNRRDSVFYAYCPRNTNLGTVTASEAAIGASLRSSVDHGTCLAG